MSLAVTVLFLVPPLTLAELCDFVASSVFIAVIVFAFSTRV
jgi:hypothetical protein